MRYVGKDRCNRQYFANLRYEDKLFLCTTEAGQDFWYSLNYNREFEGLLLYLDI